jgi:mRNA interferase MazF
MAATIRTAVTFQKTLFDQAEALAQQLHISRSQLIEMALENFIRQKLLDDNGRPDPNEPENSPRQAAQMGEGPGGIHQGDIFWVHAAAPGESEPGYPHPHVVVQEDVFNRSRIHSVVVCALTSNMKRGKFPGNVFLEAGEANLPRRSVVEVSKVSTVDKTQLGEYVGSLTRQRVNQILAGMRFLQSMT